MTTAYPFLLNCYNDYDQGLLENNDFVKILQLIENFMVRRFICNVPTNQLNKIFPALYIQAKSTDIENLFNGVRATLQSKNYPKDSNFLERLKDAKLYGSGERNDRTKLILESIEESFNHKEHIDFSNITIEHVMPQTLTNWWQEHLGEDWETTYDLYLDTLGNLTLTGYNPELSNSDFQSKCDYYKNSNIQLNKYFNDLERWDRDAIELRTMALIEKALKIWPYFGDESGKQITSDVTGTKLNKLIILGQQFKVESWRDVLQHSLNTIADLEPEKFDEIIKKYPHLIGFDDKRFRRVRQLNNGAFFEVNCSANVIHRFCIQVMETIGLTSEDWVVEIE